MSSPISWRIAASATANTAVFIWIDGFSFSALIRSKILGDIPRISPESGQHFAEDSSF